MAYHSVYDLYDLIAAAVQARDAEWRERAACRGLNATGEGPHFASAKDEGVERAKAVCKTCPVMGECHTEWKRLPPAMQKYGVWAGKHGEEWLSVMT